LASDFWSEPLVKSCVTVDSQLYTCQTVGDIVFFKFVSRNYWWYLYWKPTFWSQTAIPAFSHIFVCLDLAGISPRNPI